MGAREDFMVLRRAAVQSLQVAQCTESRMATKMAALFHKTSASEMAFLQSARQPFYTEVVDLAYAMLNEERPAVDGTGSGNRL